MPLRVWPMRRGCIITSGFGPRWGTMHRGVDLGWPGGSAGLPVYAAQGGTLVWERWDPAGFGYYLGVDHPTDDGAGFTVYGHCRADLPAGTRVEAGQQIGHINADRATNGGVDPHLHFEVFPAVWSPGAQLDPLPWLSGAAYVDDLGAPGSAADDATWSAILEQMMGPRL